MTYMSNILDEEIKFFDSIKSQLLEHHLGKFIIISNGKLAGSYDTFDAAAKEAIKQFGKGPYLIRQVGQEPLRHLPASVAYRPVHAPH